MRKASKRFVLFFTVLILTLFWTNVQTAHADEGGTIHSVRITADLLEDGSADITEVWSVEIDPSTGWTEWYLPKDHLNGSEISHFTVREGEKIFTSLGDDWDVQGSLAEKAGTCGINYDTNADLELCWGIGSYGPHQFAISYHVTELVDAYPDQDGFNWRFINDQMVAVPQYAEVRIRAPFPISEENARIWLYGNTGNIHFTHADDDDFGIILAEAAGDEYSSEENHMTIVAGFDKDLFQPSRLRENETFEDLSERAKVGSDFERMDQMDGPYPEDENFAFPSSGSWMSGFFANHFDFFIALIFLPIFFGLKKGRDSHGDIIVKYSFHKKELEDLPYEREPAFEGELLPNYTGLSLVEALKSPSDLISALLLEWMFAGYIRFEETERKRFFGLSNSMENSIRFIEKENPFAGKDPIRADFWTYLLTAAGGDQILQEHELERYVSGHYQKFFSLLEKAYQEGLKDLVSRGIYEKKRVKKILFSKEIYQPNTESRDRLSKILAFKKFLQDYTLIGERSAKEVALWDSYLIFAALYGIADEVAKEFKEMNPRYFERFEANYGGRDFWTTYYMLNAISHTGYNQAVHSRSAASSASSGGGGMGSFGGGGGFSGGGSGGGGR